MVDKRCIIDPIMLRNYLKIAWRNIQRHKVYTAINVIGLSLGISACVIIYLIAAYDFSFDKFHPDKDRIYRIVGEMRRSSGETGFVNCTISDVAGFEHDIPGFEVTAGYHLFGENVTIPDGTAEPKKFDGRSHREGSWTAAGILTGPSYFDIFKYKWLTGNASAAMSQPFKVVLTHKRAIQYFGNIPLERMMGRTVVYMDSLQVNVAGIVKDWEENTDFGYTDFISISTATHSFLKAEIPTEDWNSLRPHRGMAFVKLSKETTAKQINARFADYVRKHVKPDNPGSNLTMTLQPLTKIHYTNEFHRGDDGDSFQKLYPPVLYALTGVALFILVIAMINFINLSTAQSIQRAREIGIRKVMGSSKGKIMIQFLIETGALTGLAVILSVLLLKPIIASFAKYIPESIMSDIFRTPTVLFLIVVTVITTLLAGFYPAKILASYLPVESLKNNISSKGTDKINLRKALIVFQFTISLVFIIGVLVIGKQIRYMQTTDKGFSTDEIITMENWDDHEGKLAVFAQHISHIAGVKAVIRQGTAPMGFAQNIVNFKYRRKQEDSYQVLADMGTHDFIPFYEMKMIAGRNMMVSDSLKELVINETFSKALGFTNPADAIGQVLYVQSTTGELSFPICGVVADYHTSSFHESIKPLVIENVPDRMFGVAVKLEHGENMSRVKTTLALLEREWKIVFPEKPFNYSFLDESISRLFEQEENTKWLMNSAMSITILISCMGLFGLGMFTAQKRTREIGIRKVLGATVANITTMLSKDFVLLVLIAMAIATPVSWYFMNQWLQDFAYRTQIEWWIFGLAGLIAICIALITISFQAIPAAMRNPVKSLRTE